MFFEKYKKIIFIFGFMLAIFVLGFFIYSLFFKPALQNQPAPGENAGTQTGTSSANLPQSGKLDQVNNIKTPSKLPGGQGTRADSGQTQMESRISELTDKESLGAAINQNGLLQYYNKDDGKFYLIDRNGNISPLSDKVFHSVENITWSPNKNKAILEYPDGANIIYDFSSDKQISLPSHWKDFGFSPDGKNIVTKSIGTDPNNRWLAIVNEDGTKAQKIESLGEKDETVYTSWSPNNQTIAMYTEGIDFNRQEVFFVGLHNENFKSLTVEGRGFQQQWTPDGNRLLYSVYSSASSFKPSLWIANAKSDSIGSGRTNLNIETWAEKCVFADAANAYCAIPKDLPENAGLFPELAENTEDLLYHIDVNTGAKKLIYSPEENYNMSDVIVSNDGGYIYFTDAKTKKLYKVKI